VEEFESRPFQIVLPSVAIDAIAVETGGAHPSYADGYYDRDNAFYEAWGPRKPRPGTLQGVDGEACTRHRELLRRVPEERQGGGEDRDMSTPC
jgi:hypothetical protein